MSGVSGSAYVLTKVDTVFTCRRAWDSSVGIETSYGLDGPEIEFRWMRDIPHPSRPALWSTHSPILRGLGLYLSKWPGCGADHSPHLVPSLKEV